MGFSLEHFFSDLILIIEDMENHDLEELLEFVKAEQKYAKECGAIQ